VTLEEFSDMWARTFEKFEREVRQEEREAGEKHGETKLLLRQLEWKFGPLDARTRARVHRAGPDRLLAWADRILTAERLEEVFEG
jgi:hypothetical protein